MIEINQKQPQQEFKIRNNNNINKNKKNINEICRPHPHNSRYYHNQKHHFINNNNNNFYNNQQENNNNMKINRIRIRRKDHLINDDNFKIIPRLSSTKISLKNTILISSNLSFIFIILIFILGVLLNNVSIITSLANDNFEELSLLKNSSSNSPLQSSSTIIRNFGILKPNISANKLHSTDGNVNDSDDDDQKTQHLFGNKKKITKIDYTNHSIMKIANRDINLLLLEQEQRNNATIPLHYPHHLHHLHHGSMNNNDNDNDDVGEVLWYDNSNINKTYAFVRLTPKHLKRIKRDLHYLSEPPLFITSNLQSWLDGEHQQQQQQFNNPLPLQSAYHHQPHGSYFSKNNFFLPPSIQSPPPPSSPLLSSSPTNRINRQINPFESFHIAATTNDNLVDDIDEPIYSNDDLMSHNNFLLSSTSTQNALNVPIRYSKLVPSFQLNRYHPLSQINFYMKEVAKTVPGVTLFTIGYTHENRPIQAIEILNNPNDPNFMWIDGCTHAREWITVTTALYAIEKAILSKIPVNFIIVPILNVDGYVYTWTKDRMWRKNRRPYIASRLSRHQMPERCTGVDLNRNYDINFGGTGSSKNPCSFLYQGPYPFSEPEVRAAADLISNNRNRIKMTLSLHSFNQLWACPNAFSNERTKDHEHHMRVLRSIQKSVHQTNGVLYDIGPLGAQLYLGSGFMMDWIYHKLGIRDAYLVELRDRGYYGFILPADQIWPTATETWAGIRAAIKHVFLV